MTENVTIFAIVCTFCLTFLLLGFIVFFVLRYNHKQQEFIRKEEQRKKEYEAAIYASRIEIVEQTLQTISQEIHDNFAQRLTLAILYLQSDDEWSQHRVTKLADLINATLNDMRSFSRNLNGNFVVQEGLDAALLREAQLVESGNDAKCHVDLPDNEILFSDQEQIIVFRCVQESIGNALRHGRAKRIDIVLGQDAMSRFIDIRDNGTGFSLDDMKPGLGIANIKKRMSLIGGTCRIQSSSIGTSVLLKLPANEL